MGSEIDSARLGIDSWAPENVYKYGLYKRRKLCNRCPPPLPAVAYNKLLNNKLYTNGSPHTPSGQRFIYLCTMRPTFEGCMCSLQLVCCLPDCMQIA